MRLHELVTEAASQDMAKRKLNIAIREITMLYNNAVTDLEEEIQADRILPMLPVYSRIAKWVTDNYFTSKQTSGYKLESVLQALNLPAPKYTAGRDSSANGKIALLKNMLNGLAGKGVVDGSALKTLADVMGRFAEGAATMKEMYANRHEKTDPNRDAKAQAAKKQSDNAAGKQRADADMLVNQVLSSLPKELAATIRQQISRSDNKVKALHAAMKSHGLAESKALRSAL